MKVLTLNDVQLVTGAGVLATEFSNAGSGFGSAMGAVFGNDICITNGYSVID